MDSFTERTYTELIYFISQTGVHNKNCDIALAIDVISCVRQFVKSVFIAIVQYLKKTGTKDCRFFLSDSYSIFELLSVKLLDLYCHLCGMNSLRENREILSNFFVVELVPFVPKPALIQKAVSVPIHCVLHEM